jgi:hypothetical protein
MGRFYDDDDDDKIRKPIHPARISSRVPHPHATNREKSSNQEEIAHSLFINIIPDLLECPTHQRVDLDQTPLIDLDHLQPLPLFPLTPPPPRNNPFHAQFLIRPLSGFDLDQIIIRRFIRLPQLRTVEGFKGLHIGCVERGVGMEGGEVGIGGGCRELEGFGKVVERVQEDL